MPFETDSDLQEANCACVVADSAVTAAKRGCNLLLCACRCHVALAAMVTAIRLDAPDMHGTLQLCAEYAPRSCQTSHRCARYNESVVTQKNTHSYSSSLVTLCFDSVGPTPRNRVVRHVQLAVQSHAACRSSMFYRCKYMFELFLHMLCHAAC